MLNEVIPAALNDQRLDRIVALIADVSRASAASLIQAGGVVVDGVCAVTGKTKIAEGQSISIDLRVVLEHCHHHCRGSNHDCHVGDVKNWPPLKINEVNNSPTHPPRPSKQAIQNVYKFYIKDNKSLIP